MDTRYFRYSKQDYREEESIIHKIMPNLALISPLSLNLEDVATSAAVSWVQPDSRHSAGSVHAGSPGLASAWPSCTAALHHLLTLSPWETMRFLRAGALSHSSLWTAYDTPFPLFSFFCLSCFFPSFLASCLFLFSSFTPFVFFLFLTFSLCLSLLKALTVFCTLYKAPWDPPSLPL